MRPWTSFFVTACLALVATVAAAQGLMKTDTVVGKGAEAKAGQNVQVNYTGWLHDPAAPNNRGAKFDSSKDRGDPFSFPLGAGHVIRGWDEGVQGMKVGGSRRLIIPPSLEPTAIRLTKTELRPGTANNDVNAIHTTAGGIPEGYMVNDYLTSAKAWFLLTNIKGLVYMERIPYEMDMQVDFTTDNLLVKGYERYSFGYYNWRSIWGSFPTS